MNIQVWMNVVQVMGALADSSLWVPQVEFCAFKVFEN